MMMKRVIKNHALALLGAAIGGAAGYAYYFYIGCVSGTCPITSSPVMSVIWGAVIGGLLLSLFKKKKTTDE